MIPAHHFVLGAPSPAPAHNAAASRENTPSSSARALDAAFRRERHVLLGFFARRVGGDVAADLVQDVFTRAAGNANFADITNQRAYLMQIARNLLIDRSRQQKRSHADFAPFDEERMPVAQPDPFWWIEAADLVAAYQRAIRTMSPKTREVFVMSRVDQLSYREIGDRLGLGRKGIEHRMRRALLACRRALAVVDCSR